VRVITLCPGSVDTPIFDSVAPGDIKPVKSTRLREYTQEKKISISADRFAELALNDIAKTKPHYLPAPISSACAYLSLDASALSPDDGQNLRDEMQRLNSPQN
jgi:short-subunit dehydrogenase